ncbi:hypothetical protein [Arthrobacter sp. JSM 101049]|uniref:hypothetical protein n=1 Tax=Arthrobacter sp. JSM 101049 TaxID=929097 RepID=UPI003565E81D
MDIQVESSVVLAAMIAVLLAFIVPSIIRRGQKPAEPALALASTPSDAVEAPRTARPNDTPRPRRNTMATPARPRTAAPQQAPFRIRYGRLGVALAGVLAVVLLVVGGVLAPFGVVSGLVPLVAAFVLAGSFVGLRALAVRDRRRKVLARMDAVFHEAMHSSTPTETVVRHTATTVFDAREQDAPERAVHEAAAPHARTAPAAAPAPRTWDPVAVPKPSYVGAAKAERPAPEPLPAAEQKKPQKVTSILQETRIAEQSAHLADRDASAGHAPEATPITEAPARRPAPATGGINLDAVLQRRRA